jgi:hypothetical protein
VSYSQPNYPYHFLQAFLNELLGRYAHLQQFVEKTRIEAATNSPKLLEVYSRQLLSRINELVDNVDDLAVSFPDTIEPEYLIDVFHNLQKQSSDFQQLHRTLRWFSAPWPEAEIFAFLKRTLEDSSLHSAFHHLNASIVFSDEYNFLTYDVGHVKKAISREQLTAWAIPKSESSNPLFWSVLVHEVAHSLFKDETIFNHVSNGLSSSDIDEPIELVKRWAVELNADLFAFRILGPAYLYSLMYFSMFFVRSNLREPIVSERKDSRSLHPPPETRIRILNDEVASLGLAEGNGDCENALHVFRNLFGERLAFDNTTGYEALDFNDLLLSPDTLLRLWDLLKDFQREYCPLRGFSIGDVKLANQLSARLASELPAGSLAERCDPEVVQRFVSNDSGVSRETALSRLDEKPAQMSHIINAGWASRIIGNMWKMPVFEEVSSLRENRVLALPKLLESLTEPARQLQTSIQVALILSSLN